MTSFPAGQDSANIEHLANGTTCEWLHNRQIYIITSSDSSRATIDAWVDRSIEIAKAWPDGHPLCVVVDASNPKISRTPYMRARLREFQALRPELKWYVAMIAPKTYLMQLMKLSLQPVKGNRETRICFSRNEALGWLKSKL